jgi:hypothetical protein
VHKKCLKNQETGEYGKECYTCRRQCMFRHLNWIRILQVRQIWMAYKRKTSKRKSKKQNINKWVVFNWPMQIRQIVNLPKIQFERRHRGGEICLKNPKFVDEKLITMHFPLDNKCQFCYPRKCSKFDSYCYPCGLFFYQIGIF